MSAPRRRPATARPRAVALVVIVALLTGCAPGAAPSSSPTPSPAVTPSAMPTLAPQPEPSAQAFGGDCDGVMNAVERDGELGPWKRLDPLLEAQERMFETAAIVSAGGIVCGGDFDDIRLTVVVLPASVAPVALQSNEEPCFGSSSGCDWYIERGEWWVSARSQPLQWQTWQEDPAQVERVAGMLIDRAQEWRAPTYSTSRATIDCRELLGAVRTAVPDAGLEESGWGIGGVQVIALAARLASGCAWFDSNGQIDLVIQPAAGAPSGADLALLGAVSVGMPDGRDAAQVTVTPDHGYVIATSGPVRVSIAGASAVVDPARVAAILAVVLEEMS